MIRTAIELKEAVETVPDHFDPIGSCPLDVFQWKDENDKYDDYYGMKEVKDESDEKQVHYVRMKQVYSCLEQIQESLKTKYYQTFSLGSEETPVPYVPQIGKPSTPELKGDQIHIEIGGFEYVGGFDIPEDTLNQLFDISPDAPYGDVEKLETVVDKEVRDARDISLDHFSVSEDVIRQIEAKWREGEQDGYMYPRHVVVKPYKINLYGKEGHFDLHQDTPGKDMVGTALVALTEDHGGKLYITSPHDKSDTYKWDQKAGDCIMFYTDCPHVVSKVWKKKIRGTVAFKIYHNQDEEDLGNANDIIQINHVITEIKKLEEIIEQDSGYGFILGHGYSLQTNTFKGKDQILVSALERMGHKVKVIPIVHRWYVNSWHEDKYDEDDEDEEEATSSIYPFTEAHIDKILKNSDNAHIESIETTDNISFYRLNGEDYVWKNEHQEYCEHVGNEAQAEEQNSIYLSRALIVI